jgi:hypothetical protein
MTIFVILAWLSFAAWVYRDAERCHAADGGYPAIRLWSPGAWTLQALLVPGFGGLGYLQARRLAVDETAPMPGRWQLIAAPVGWTMLLFGGFMLGTLWSAPTSTALVMPGSATPHAVARMTWGDAHYLTATVDHVRFAVTSHERTRLIRYGTGETAASGQFVVLNLAVRNIGTQPELLMPSRFVLIDAAGRTYSSSFAGETAQLFRTGHSLMLEPLQPGLERRGELVFDVPATASRLRLAIRGPGPIPEKALLPVS